MRGLGKVAIVGGALYVTVDQGIWSESKQASSALDRITTKVMLTDDYLKQVPSVSQTSKLMKRSWNSGVQTVCSAVADSPQKVSNWTGQMISSVMDSGNK